MSHEYPEPDDEEGFLFVREWEDQRLTEEAEFLAELVDAVESEIRHRMDIQYTDGTTSEMQKVRALSKLREAGR